MNSNSSPPRNSVKGWLLDVYPSEPGKVAVWVIAENGKRIKFTDSFQPCIYISAKQTDLEGLITQLYNNEKIASINFVKSMRMQPTPRNQG